MQYSSAVLPDPTASNFCVAVSNFQTNHHQQETRLIVQYGDMLTPVPGFVSKTATTESPSGALLQ